MSELTSSTIVPEVLTEHNYGSWKIWVKSYLLGQDLWDIVDGTEPMPPATGAKFKSWRMKNGKALHAIQISCGAQMFSLIREKDLAKDAWDHIAFTHRRANEGTKDIETSSKEQGSATQDYSGYLALYTALDTGNWGEAKIFLDNNCGAIRSIISSSGETPLHLATLVARRQIVYKLVDMMTPEDLEIKNIYGNTALVYAAILGNIDIALIMVARNENLPRVRNGNDLFPVVLASYNGNKEMARFLYQYTPTEELSPEASKINGATLLTTAITADIYDIALDLLVRYPELAITKDFNDKTAISVLARRHSAFPSGNKYVFWQRWIYSGIHVQLNRISHNKDGKMDKSHEDHRDPKVMIIQGRNQLLGVFFKIIDLFGMKQLHSRKIMNTQVLEVLKLICSQISTLNDQQVIEAGVISALFVAIEHGIVEFVAEIIKSHPLLIWKINEDGQGIFKAAVIHRQEKIFNLIYGMRGKKAQLVGGQDKFNNNMLHLAARLAPSSRLDKVSGAALQMQRELQWFKEVECMVKPKCKEELNDDHKTPRALFTEEHKALVKEGEKWMKDTATACMVVSTLIATVMFAAAFTVPGGNYGDSGVPIFLRHSSFMVFIISDTLSLYSSCTSVLMFLYILTSRYAEERFLKTLPKRLIIGLASLFFSIATMMVAFGATLYITLHERLLWVAIPLSLLATVPVSLYALLQYPLFIEIVTFTYGSGIFNRKKGV